MPILLLVAAAAAGLGLAGFGVSEALDSVDKVMVDTSDQIVRLGLIGGAGYVGYVVLRRMKVI